MATDQVSGNNDAVTLPASPSPEYRVIELGAGSEAILQRFFEDNPQYFESVNGQPPRLSDVHEEIHGTLPSGWPFTRKWAIGYTDAHGTLLAMTNIVSDLLAPSVWHISTFIVATSRHGSGVAQALYQSLESWAFRSGAQWIRLGVVQGHARAERFWEQQGFIQTRVRLGVSMGSRVNSLRVMFKPLAGGTLAEYLALIERDRPETLSGTGDIQ